WFRFPAILRPFRKYTINSQDRPEANIANISVSLDYTEHLSGNMQSTVFTILFVKLLCLTLHGMTAVLAELPSPSNIRITSINMGLVLEWDPPQNHTGNLTYRSEYKG
ncbi:unnamed protein product, partial [Oncorhynchus mykiss]